MASFLSCSGLSVRPAVSPRRRFAVAKSAAATLEPQDGGKSGDGGPDGEGISGRRAVVFAAAAAAIYGVGYGDRISLAGEDLKRGTPEAKKKYAPVCVTMPTARICHK